MAGIGEMMEFMATKNGDSTEIFSAESVEQAIDICELKGMQFNGEVLSIIDAEKTTIQQMDDLVSRLNSGRLDS